MDLKLIGWNGEPCAVTIDANGSASMCEPIKKALLRQPQLFEVVTFGFMGLILLLLCIAFWRCSRRKYMVKTIYQFIPMKIVFVCTLFFL